VDEQQIERHFQFDEIQNMYNYEDDTSERPTPVVPKDRLLADLLISQKDWIFSYLEHDSLLENKEEEELTESERKAAWDEYTTENTQERMPQGLLANEPWVLSTLPKLKMVHPNKSMPELYQLCLESKRDYLNLQQIFTMLQNNSGMQDNVRMSCEQKITETITRLKATFGDTVNWNAHFAEKAKADAAALREKQILAQQAQQQARMLMAGRPRLPQVIPNMNAPQLYRAMQQPNRFQNHLNPPRLQSASSRTVQDLITEEINRATAGGSRNNGSPRYFLPATATAGRYVPSKRTNDTAPKNN